MSGLNPLFSDDVANAIQRLYKNQYDDMSDDNGCYIGYIKKEYDIFIIQENLKRLSSYEALEKRSKELYGMQLNELVEHYKLLDVWKYIIMKKAEEQKEEFKNEKSK